MGKKVLIEDFQEFLFASAPIWSVDGKFLYYFSTKASIQDNCYYSRLMMLKPGEKGVPLSIDPATRQVIPLKSGKLLYSSRLTGKDKEFVDSGGNLTVLEEAFPDGRDRQEVLRLPFRDVKLKKIDEDRFIVIAICKLGRPDIESMEGEEQQTALAMLRDEQQFIVCDELPFCADGRGYISGERRRVFICDLSKHTFYSITDQNFEVGDIAVCGDLLAFAGVPHAGIRDLSQGLYLYDLKNNVTKILTPPGKFHIKNVEFVGGEIIAAANPWKGFSSRYGHSLYRFDQTCCEEPTCRVDLSGEDLGFCVASDCSFGSGTVFASSGDRLYFISTLRNTCVLSSWSEREGVRRLTQNDFSAEFFAISEEQIAIYGSSWGELQEIYLLQKNDKLECLTDMNRPYMQSHTISKPIAIQTKNRIGMPIDGWVIPPANYDKNKRYPALLEIHGGPRLIYSFGFFHEKQVMAANGFFVFFCNPRGSAGRGNAFANIKGIRGTIDYQDIMDFNESILNLYPQIDRRRLAVSGGSYGGFMVNWIIGHTNLFAAAVSCRSNSNIVGNYGVSDNGIWSLDGSYGGNIWAGHDLIWSQSPLKYAENATTPTLFLHSLEDYSCRFPNSIQMYVALRTHGTDTRMVLFKGDYHSLSRTGKPKNRRRRLKELCEWIGKYTSKGDV